jgi:hypothetical protein
MSLTTPVFQVQKLPEHWRTDDGYAQWPWQDIAPLPPFIVADGSGPARDQTSVRLAYDAHHLYARFDCHDRDIWGVATERDSPIYDEEVVELFIAPGPDTPTHYYEFEVSPLGTLLDLTVHSPSGDRADMHTDFAWNCPGLIWSAQRNDAARRWTAYLIVPWRSIGAGDRLPTVWRANFYRIERPRGEPPEFSCWSPTLTEPADYHRPARFGRLELSG